MNEMSLTGVCARMKLVVQRVLEASVEVEGSIVGKVQEGALVLVGIGHEDNEDKGDWLAEKFANLRMFKDEEGKPNRSILDRKGGALIVSQFTLYADCKVGRRPSFIQAAPPELAVYLYEKFVAAVRAQGVFVQTGIFGAKMKVSLVNDGPFTLLLER